MKSKYRNTNNYELSMTSLEDNSQEVITIPGEALTVKEILKKYVRGVAPEISKLGLYDDDPDFDDYDPISTPDFDLVDATEMLNEIEQNISERKRAKKKTDTTQVAQNEPIRGVQAIEEQQNADNEANEPGDA